MALSEIGRSVIAILAAQALVDPAGMRESDRLEEFGLDSLGLVEAIFAIEERFDIQVPFNPNEPDQAGPGDLDVSTVGGIIRGIEALIAAKAP
ncbi:acyl carrier protein [Pseudogemmobacter bohemicus]|uniref:acyl carrier protein n=1 Tax=Pseudogemmobacter bohemicus TaxID=2250708 RepID=UPI000DD2F961|nr:acyl carrier protein [Pseudogemmobacter bohemicus]